MDFLYVALPNPLISIEIHGFGRYTDFRDTLEASGFDFHLPKPIFFESLWYVVSAKNTETLILWVYEIFFNTEKKSTQIFSDPQTTYLQVWDYFSWSICSLMEVTGLYNVISWV